MKPMIPMGALDDDFTDYRSPDYLHMLPDGWLYIIREDLRLSASIDIDDYARELQVTLLDEVRKFPLHVIVYFIHEAIRTDPEHRLKIKLINGRSTVKLDSESRHEPERIPPPQPKPKPGPTWLSLKEDVRSHKPRPKPEPKFKADRKKYPSTPEVTVDERKFTPRHKLKEVADLAVVGSVPEPQNLWRNGCYTSALPTIPDTWESARPCNATKLINEIMGTFRDEIFP